MADRIRNMVTKGDTLHLLQGSGIWSLKAELGKEPNEWKVTHFANVGTSEEFIEMFSGEIAELIDMAQLYGEARDRAKNAVVTMLIEGLMPAFEHLKKIRALSAIHLPELNRRQLYEDFGRALWHAYKDLFPKAVKTLGFNIGFLFQKDAIFEAGLTNFLSMYPPFILDVAGVLRRQRTNWQQALADFRNEHLEHRHLETDPARFRAFYEPKTAEMLFDHAWRTMAEVFPAVLESRFPPNVFLVETPSDERNPEHLRRWRMFLCEPVVRANFPV